MQSAADSSRSDRGSLRGLDLSIAVVRATPSKAFTPAERTELVGDARRIEAVLAW